MMRWGFLNPALSDWIICYRWIVEMLEPYSVLLQLLLQIVIAVREAIDLVFKMRLSERYILFDQESINLKPSNPVHFCIWQRYCLTMIPEKLAHCVMRHVEGVHSDPSEMARIAGRDLHRQHFASM